MNNKQTNNYMKIINGDSLKELKTLEENSIDAVVTDPPYGLKFMGKKWDYDVPSSELWVEVMRVLKPGGHLLSFAGSRTYHRMAVNIEDAGFEVRDMITWNYGSGFPKSLNISKSIGKSYRVGLCTCNVFEPMVQLEYENNNNTDEKGNGDDARQGVSIETQMERGSNQETQSETGNKIISAESGTRNNNGNLCELRQEYTKKKQGLEEVKESVLQQGLPESGTENKGHGNVEVRKGLETGEGISKSEGQSVSDLQTSNNSKPTSTPSSPIQDGREKQNEQPCESLQKLSFEDRESNRKRITEIKNECNSEEWNNLSRFICSECFSIKKDIGGTALKPSIEPIVVARKPLSEKTIAKNVLEWGTGGINIDGCRVEYQSKEDMENNGFRKTNKQNEGKVQTENDQENQRWSTGLKQMVVQKEQGRFPANFIHDGSDEVVGLFPEQKGSIGRANRKPKDEKSGMFGLPPQVTATEFKDSGSAARFFYCAKASKKDRNEGLEVEKENNPRPIGEAFGSGNAITSQSEANGNNHPTVKPTALMQYLVRLVTPVGGTVLDPFMGSGSTGKACVLEGFDFIGIELDPEYCKIAEARINL